MKTLEVLEEHMKILKRFISLALVAAMAMSIFAGCGKEVTADSYVLALYNLIINGSDAKAKEIGVGNASIKTFQLKREEAVSDGTAKINESFQQQCGVSVDETLLKDYYAAYFQALSKLTAKASVIEKNDSVTKVEISSTCLDMTALTTKAMEAAQSKVKASDYDNDVDYKKVVLTEYIKALTSVMQNFSPNGESQTTTVTCKKANNSWECVDDTSFAEALTALAVKSQVS